MIGVVADPADWPVVKEFFELFKTPWELARPGRVYEVLLIAGNEAYDCDSKLTLVYSSAPRKEDMALRLTAGPLLAHTLVMFAGRELPLYGPVQTFGGAGAVVLRSAESDQAAGVKLMSDGRPFVRLGYDLFQEIARLLSAGQPAEHAAIPALELHIAILRHCIVEAGIDLVEIPPVPAGHEFIVCLTHDIDFFGIRNHRFDHTFFGFLYRATVGAALDFLRGKISFRRLAQNWQAVLKVPLVHLGLARDFWLSFEWYLNVEHGLPATYFFIPFKGRAGEQVPGPGPSRRAAPYDVAEHRGWLEKLLAAGCEVGVHGIDAWHDVAGGRAELAKITSLVGSPGAGIRMHWLLHNHQTPQTLDEAGYTYDSTAGYNEAVGYRCGTVQVFRPGGAKQLLELPLHIQDGALFYRGRLGLSEEAAWQRCQTMLDNAQEFGGVLTLLWHDRSPGPERFWGDFYARLVKELRGRKVWFASGSQAVSWFRKRRDVILEQVGDIVRMRRVSQADGAAGQDNTPSLRVRYHAAQGCDFEPIELPWADGEDINLAALRNRSASRTQSGARVAETATRPEGGVYAASTPASGWHKHQTARLAP